MLDTSRNGQGPWSGPDAAYPGAPADADPQVWCNPPERGLGARPTTSTGDALIDAYLWIKVPGESDGQCYRGTGGPLDPERGIEDPAAGQWFVEQAHELIEFAEPPIDPLDCHVSWDARGCRQGVLGQAPRRRCDRAAPVVRVVRRPEAIKATRATVSQTGHVVTLTASGASKPGKAPDLVLSAKGSAEQPWIFWLDGAACTSD